MSGQGVEPHRLLDPRDRRSSLARERQVDAPLYDESRIVWIQREGALQMMVALGEVRLHERNPAHDAVTLGVAFIQARCLVHQLSHLFLKFRSARTKFV